MQPDQPDEKVVENWPGPGEPAEEPGAEQVVISSRAPERRLLFWFLIVLGVSTGSLLWLALRADVPAAFRTPLDFVLQAATGGVLAYVAFRALFLYPFRILELLMIVLVLSLGMKQTIDFLYNLKVYGLIGGNIVDSAHIGEIFQICLISGSVLLMGAAFGLRNCSILKLDRAAPRMLSVVSGMFALPASAGLVTFPVLILRDFMLFEKTPEAVPLFMVLWLFSILFTCVNLAYFIKTMTLTAQINAQEKMP